jgi:NAD(P) transhydrogenase subunit alpha
VLDFLKLVIDKDGKFTVNLEDDIVAACLMCMGGEIRRKA